MTRLFRLFPSALLFSSPMVLVTTVIMPLAAAASCSSQTTCGACINVDGGPFDKCGWCGDGKGGGVCAKGNSFGPSSDKCADNCWEGPPSFNDKGVCHPTCSGTTCSECVTSGGPATSGGTGGSCSWCENTRTCYWAEDTFGHGCGHECPKWIDGCLKTSGDTTEPFDSCPAVQCSTMDTCAKCADNSGCSWCATDQKCIAAPSNGRSCTQCSGGIDCKKYDHNAQCPNIKCSVKNGCKACASTPGCGWDASNLVCSETSDSPRSVARNCEDDISASIIGCFYTDPGLCPATKTQRCDAHKNCRECATDVACGWSSFLGECVEAARLLNTPTSLGGCRGGTPFSYFDCEPQCNSHTWNCTACHQDPAGCTLCSGEVLYENKRSISRCVLREGAKKGEGDSTKTEYPHQCKKVVQEKECDECSRLSNKNVGKILFPKEATGKDAGEVCEKCLANQECGLCTSQDGAATACVRGDQYGSYDRDDTTCFNAGPFNIFPDDFHRSMNWQHAGAGSSFSGDGVTDDLTCTNHDMCAQAATCEQCFALNGSTPDAWQRGGKDNPYILLCAWCDDGMPLRKNKRSPCRASGPQGELLNTEWKDNLCAADDRTPSVDQCPSYNCSSAGDTCLRCLTGTADVKPPAVVKRKDCGWDPAASTCVPAQTPYSYTTFPLVWGDATLCPEVCGQHKTCSECGAADGCGWCSYQGTFSGNGPGGDGGSCQPSDPDGTRVNFRVTGHTCVPFDSTGECKGLGGVGAGGVVAAVFITIAVVTVGMWVGAVVALRRGALPSCVAQSPCMGCVTKSSQMLPGGDAAGDGEGNYKDLNTVLS